jgi:lipoprotein-anchoring transpeptidase ErfK/SrfK
MDPVARRALGGGRLRVRHRLALLAASVAVIAPLAASDALDPGDAQSAAPAPREPVPSAFERARTRGQPIAVLTRRTVLRASPGGRAIGKLRRRTEFGTPTVLAAVAQRGNWLRVISTVLPNGRTGWIPASAAGVVATPWTLRVDLSRRTVTVTKAGTVVRRFRVAIGKPSTPTPTGRFAVTDKLDFIGGSSAYGCCAVALTGHQTHIEPGWRGGDRLAIHGTHQTGTIGQAASFGCLRARDSDVRWLVHHAYLGSIVEIRR